MTENKRILFLADINSVHTQNWVRGFVEQGYEIGLFSLGAMITPWGDDLERFTYQCYGVNQSIVKSNKKWAKIGYFSAKKELKKFCESFSPDVVHAHYASSYGMLAMRLKFPKTVLSLWGSDVYDFPKKSFLHKQLFKKILKSIPIVCSTSKDMAREASIYVKKEYFITPFGVNMKKFVPTIKKHDVLTIGTVKLLEEIYGIDRLINLFAEFSKRYEKETRLLIYGSGSQQKNLEKLVNDLGIREMVEFKGFVSRENVVEAFNSLDIFVALSRRESFGVAVLEAQACGLPVLVSNVGGLPEVTGEHSGIIIDGDDLEMGILSLFKFSDDARRTEMGEKARIFVEQNFSEQVCINKLIDVYDKV